MKKFFVPFLFVVLAVVVLNGCANKQVYHVIVKNVSSQQLNEVRVKFDKFNFLFGVLIVNAEAGHGHASDISPLPDKATVEWVTPDKAKHSKMVEVKSQLPAGFREESLLEFTGVIHM